MSDKHESILHELADSLLDYFEGSGAVNYIEQIFECKEDSSKSFVLTMQKTQGLTPCQKLAAANEEIKKLQAENAELKKQGQWISVDDELPELNKTVMIDSGSGFDFARFNGGYWTRKAWPLGYAPKYWMPLPTPPEGE